MPPGSKMAAILQKGHIDVGVDDTSPFLATRGDDGTYTGFEVDLAREIARAIFGDISNIDTTINFIPVTTEKKFSVLDGPDRAVDITISVATMSCDRWQRYNLSSPYYQAFQQLAVPAGSSITGQADLSGKRVCVTKPSSSFNLLDDLNMHGAKIDVVPVPTRPKCLIKLQDGEVDAIVLPSSIMAGLAFQDPLTVHRFETPMHDAQNNPSLNTYGVVTNRDDVELTRFINGVLDQLRARGRLKELQDKDLQPYLPVAIPPVKYWD